MAEMIGTDTDKVFVCAATGTLAVVITSAVAPLLPQLASVGSGHTVEGACARSLFKPPR
jgi:hypothetical protein